MRKHFLYLLISVLIGISCSESEPKIEPEEEILDGFNIDLSLLVSIIDKEGADLLNPSNSYINFDEFKIYHKVDGALKVYYAGHLDHPRGFRFYRPEDQPYNDLHILAIVEAASPPAISNEFQEFATTYVQWHETDMDTIRFQREKSVGQVRCTKVWVNGDLMWDFYDYSYERRFRLIYIEKEIIIE